MIHPTHFHQQQGFILASMLILMSILTLTILVMQNQLRLAQKNLRYQEQTFLRQQKMAETKKIIIDQIIHQNIPKECSDDFASNPYIPAARNFCLLDKDTRYHIEHWPNNSENRSVYFISIEQQYKQQCLDERFCFIV